MWDSRDLGAVVWAPTGWNRLQELAIYPSPTVGVNGSRGICAFFHKVEQQLALIIAINGFTYLGAAPYRGNFVAISAHADYAQRSENGGIYRLG
jgi:hypothetical protein